MQCGGQELEGKAVSSYAAALTTLLPLAEGLDGERGLCDYERSLVDTVLARVDVEAPNVFSPEEIAAASRELERYGAAIRQFDAAVSPSGPTDRDALIRITDNRLYVDVKKRYLPLVKRLQGVLAAQMGTSVDPESVSVKFSGESSMPRIAFRVISLGLLGDDMLVVLPEEQSVPLSEAAKAIFDVLPASARKRFGILAEADPLSLEVDARGRLFIMVYQRISGSRVSFRGKVEVPNSALGQWMQDLFGPPPPAGDSPPACPPRPPVRTTPI